LSQIQKIPAPDSWDFHPSYGEQISRDETFHWLIAQGEKSLKERDFSKAIPIFEKILALGRRNKKIRIYANLQLAFLYEQMKNFPKVRSYFLKAVSMDPDNAELRYQFGQLLF
jgi:Tfp pilus assembly protein PilF